MKTCSKCGNELAKDKFSKDKHSKDGLQARCKGCHKIYCQENKVAIAKQKSQHFQENRIEIAERVRIYRGKHKESIAESVKAYNQDHKEVIAGYLKQYHQDNKKHISEQKKQYQKSHLNEWRIRGQRREAAKRNLPHTLTAKQWDNIKLTFENKCCYCGEEKPLVKDHFISLSMGGEYTHNNIIPACGSCNSSKRDRDFFLWYPTRESYSEEKVRKILECLNYDKRNNQQLSIL